MSDGTKKKKMVGLIVNPIAGIGGRVGLKGSDGREVQRRALELGALPEAPDRAAAALQMLRGMGDELQIITCAGSMGEEECRRVGIRSEVVFTGKNREKTDSEDTVGAAKRMKALGVDLLLFAGGDGTARNMLEGVGSDTTVLGIPAGVKIHSGVFALNPQSAGAAARRYLSRDFPTGREAEVMDLDEEAYRRGEVRPKLYGWLLVPGNDMRVQHVKARSHSEEGELTSIAAQVIACMEEDVFYAVGAGTTTRRIMECLEIPNTLIGVDVVCNKKLVAADVSERELWQIAESRELRVVLTVIGGQGHVFGRGSQQISPRIIKKLGMEKVLLVATKEKLLSLPGHRLITDTGEPLLDRELSGYYRVTVGAGEQVVCPLCTGVEKQEGE